MSKEFLKLVGIKKYFGGVKALKGVDFSVSKGSIHYLAGENGSGKSTLIKIISGVHAPTAGQIFVEGKELIKMTPIMALQKGIQVIYQDFAVFPNLSVAENISVNRFLVEGNKIVNWNETRKIAEEVMNRISIQLDPDELLENLSVANRQLVAICRALVNDVKMLILDEPTTALTATEVERLNRIIIELKNQDIAIVIVNHKMDEVFSMADEVTILRNGESVAKGPIGDFTHENFTNHLIGRNIHLEYFIPKISDETILKVENLNVQNKLTDINFELKKGEVLGITGLLSSGRQEIGDALFGILKHDSGNVYLNGNKIELNSIQDAIKNKIGYVPEDRLTQGLFMDRTIQDNTVSASLKKYFIKNKLDDSEMYRATQSWIETIETKAPGPHTVVRDLSGGNAQKVVLSKWLNTSPSLLILNGPTVGVDVGSKSEIHRILQDLACDGVGVIVISDDLSELTYTCNRILVMWEGKIKDEIYAQETNESELTELISTDRSYEYRNKGGEANAR